MRLLALLCGLCRLARPTLAVGDGSQSDRALEDRVSLLESQLVALNATVISLQASLEESRAKLQIAELTTQQGKGAVDFPLSYKIRQKPFERVMFDWSVSFTITFGDVDMGEFRQVWQCALLLIYEGACISFSRRCLCQSVRMCVVDCIQQ